VPKNANSPTLRQTAALLGVSLGVTQRLQGCGLLGDGPEIDAAAAGSLAARPPPDWSTTPTLHRILLVTLGTPHELSPAEREADGNWRRYIGYHASWPGNRVRDAARGWWRAPLPLAQMLVATAPGGFVVGAWPITDIDARSPGGYVRLAVDDDTACDALTDTRVPAVPGPTHRILHVNKC
jgi:hypothetical protein